MKKLRPFLAGLLSCFVVVASMSSGGATGGSDRLPVRRAVGSAGGRHSALAWVPSQVLVRYRSAVRQPQRVSVRSSLGAKVLRTVPTFDVQVLDLPQDVSVREAISDLGRDPRVAVVEPNYIVKPAAQAPSDASFGDLWGFENTGQLHGLTDASAATGTPGADADVLDAWDKTTGSEDIVIAVLDTGVDVAHPDLAENIWINEEEIPGNGIDDDSNGYEDDINGWDTSDDDNVLLESRPAWGWDHGTHVAGTIAAVADNGIGVAGVCPLCRVMVIKFMSSPRGGPMRGSTAAELEGLAYAREMGADIVNGSFASMGYSTSERNALADLIGEDMLPVFAAANGSTDNDLRLVRDGDVIGPWYPASYDLPGIVSVAATQHDDEYGYRTGCAESQALTKNDCAFTNFGRYSVDIAAPGVDILSTVNGDDYQHFNGTSMASPFVAGVAGLTMAYRPQLTPLQVKNALMRGGARKRSLETIYSNQFLGGDQGWPGRWTRSNGRVDADGALTASTNDFPLSDDNINGAVPLGSAAKGAAGWGIDTSDVYAVDLVAGHSYVFELDGPPLPRSERRFSLNLSLWSPQTVELWQPHRELKTSRRVDSNDEAIAYTAQESARHYVHVFSHLGKRYGYKLRVRRLGPA